MSRQKTTEKFASRETECPVEVAEDLGCVMTTVITKMIT